MSIHIIHMFIYNSLDFSDDFSRSLRVIPCVHTHRHLESCMHEKGDENKTCRKTLRLRVRSLSNLAQTDLLQQRWKPYGDLVARYGPTTQPSLPPSASSAYVSPWQELF